MGAARAMTFAEDIKLGMGIPQAALESYYSPQLNQLNMLQQQAKLEQLQGLDPVSQQNIAASQANIGQGQERLDLARQQEQRLNEAQQAEMQQQQSQLLGAISYAGMKIQDPEQREAFFRNSAQLMGVPMDVVTPENIEASATLYEQSLNRDVKPYQQATGKGLEGYVFDPNTGQFFANPAIRQKISSLSQKHELKMSDIRDINNDVTQLTKQAREARDGANALINIGDKPTPAQAVAAIFKFMKSLDPTSVVRQEEQGLVASASGPMEAFAGYINRLTGSGPLTTEVMQDIITTASGIANSTISESKTVIDDFISVYPELDDQRRSSMLERVPDLLEPPEFKKEIPSVIPESMRDRFSKLPDSEKKKVISQLEKKGTSGQGKR